MDTIKNDWLQRYQQRVVNRIMDRYGEQAEMLIDDIIEEERRLNRKEKEMRFNTNGRI